ncbi:hypothetical protein PV10_03381 [Exophiala mesophila]|uniref:Clr5 domain-containing protein n=1 Tax=Exophiala mesophila TaxID=212818 RepID=A0A0D1Y507_EXOME|nr:uncharacterized protein PV10_03381 [Exophiala mesophila]KIV95766.1 hypothetical protein PV10_03381 [Exophiala mesophila]
MDHNFFAPPYNYRADLPLAERWKHLKLIVTQLYVEENRKAEEIRKIIHRQCGFDVGIHQLKYRIRQWKLKKNISTSAKTKMLEIRESRASRGKETVFTYQGKPVDNKKLDRQAKVLIRQGPGDAETKDDTKLKIAPQFHQMEYTMLLCTRLID